MWRRNRMWNRGTIKEGRMGRREKEEEREKEKEKR